MVKYLSTSRIEDGHNAIDQLIKDIDNVQIPCAKVREDPCLTQINANNLQIPNSKARLERGLSPSHSLNSVSPPTLILRVSNDCICASAGTNEPAISSVLRDQGNDSADLSAEHTSRPPYALHTRLDKLRAISHSFSISDDNNCEKNETFSGLIRVGNDDSDYPTPRLGKWVTVNDPAWPKLNQTSKLNSEEESICKTNTYFTDDSENYEKVSKLTTPDRGTDRGRKLARAKDLGTSEVFGAYKPVDRKVKPIAGLQPLNTKN